MADKHLRFSDNVSGPFYVDQECIDCNLCAEIAPDNFAANLKAGHDYVFKQPSNERERKLCLEALESCPVEAIGQDGDT
jgi:ferredoxin